MRFLILPVTILFLGHQGLKEQSVDINQGQEEVSQQVRAAIERGINWVKENQNRDGSWGCERNQPPSVACTGLSMIVLMCSGSSHERGPNQEHMKKGLEWLLKISAKQKNGFISAYDSTGMGILFEHACAVLVLSHIYGMAKYADIDEISSVLRRGLKTLAKSQNSDGGWSRNQQGGSSDPGVTAMCYMAIRAANKAGVKTDKADLNSLVELTKHFANLKETGDENENTGIYNVGSALRILYGLGKKNNSDTKKILAKVLKFDYNYMGGGLSEWDYVGFYLSTGALFHDDKSKEWKEWYKKTCGYLVKNLKIDGKNKGHWIIQYCLNCKCFATNLAVLTMMMPERLLPVNEY